MENIKEAAELIKNSHYVTAFTGAGISVESGIPPFRGEDGLWSSYNPEILDLSYFYRNPKSSWSAIKQIFYDFWGKASPNPAHEFLYTLEKLGYLKAIVTQNIDNLHQEAGSSTVYEFHGTLKKMVCLQCGSLYKSDKVNLEILPPVCSKCGGILKPDFIFFGEGIPEHAYKNSFEAMEKSDLVIVIGALGEVRPAADMPLIAKNNGAKIIEINIEPTRFTDSITDLFILGKAGEVSRELKKFF